MHRNQRRLRQLNQPSGEERSTSTTIKPATGCKAAAYNHGEDTDRKTEGPFGSRSSHGTAKTFVSQAVNLLKPGLKLTPS